MKPHKFRPQALILIFAPSFASQRPTGDEKPGAPLAMNAAAESAASSSFFMDAPYADII